MNFKKFALSALIILFAGISAVNSQQDQRAREILDKLSSQTISVPSVFVDFTITISSPQDQVNEEFDGNITIKEDKYRLSIMGLEIWFDGSSIYTYMPDVNEVMISDPDENGGFLSNPSELFTIYPEQFRYRFIGETTHDGNRLYEIDLHPLDLDQDFHTVKLYIDRQSNFIHSAVVAAKDGNRYIVEVNNYNNTRQVPDSYFIFNEDDYPGVEVIDMRW